MKGVERMVRVNELLKRELGHVMEREIAPRIEGVVTITEVRTAPDLRDAKVRVNLLGSDAHGSLLALLRRHRGHLQELVMRGITLKYTPRLHFEIDDTLEKADHVLGILDELGLEEEDDGNTPAS